MKRHLCMALALALIGTTLAFPALAEAPEVVGPDIDAQIAQADDMGLVDTGLFVEGAETVPEILAEPADEEPVAEEPATLNAPSPYARVQAEEAALFADPAGAQPLGAIACGSVVLTLGQEGLTRVSLFTERGVLICYADAACLVGLTNEEHAAYMDAVAAGAPAALYADNLDFPLALVACAFVDAEPVSTDIAPAEAPAVQEVVEGPAEAPAVQEVVEAPAEAPAVQEVVEGPAEAPAVQEVVEAPDADAAILSPLAGDEAVLTSEAPVAGEEALYTAEIPVSVVAAGIQLNADNISIGVKEKFGPLAVIAVPEGSAIGAVSWRSDNTKYVKVDAATGVITGVKKGAAYVVATTENGLEAVCLVNVKKAPSKVAVSPSKLTLGSGGMTAQLSWSLPKGGVTNSVTYSSSNSSVATVDANGLVTSVGAGSAVVTVKTHNGKKAKCKIKVVAAPASVVFPSAVLSLATGQTSSVNASALSSDGKTVQSSFTYAIDAASPDSGCVALDPATGAIVGVSKGQAVVTATAYNGVSASCPVVVAAGPAAIQLSEDAIRLGVKETFIGLQVDLTPAPGETECASGITWSVSNKKIVKIDATTNAILGLKKGSCTITATTVNGLTASCKVEVYKAPSKISIKPATGTLEVGQTGQYKISFSKKAGGSVRFETSDPSIATIDDDGVVTAVSVGTVAIRATSYNGKKAVAKLVVTQPSVSLPTDDSVNVDSTTSEYSETMSNAEKLEYVIYVAQTQLGKPYVYGGGYKKDSNPSGFDCSGLVYWSFLHIGVKVEASAYRQGYDETMPKITNAAELRRGDIVCFNTNSSDSDLSDHTGIYLGNGKFIHASSSAKKVMVSTLASGYYSRTFSWGRRVLQ